MALELRFTIPGQVERLIPIDQPNMKIGALLSNQVVLRAPGVDPIHALIEENEAGDHMITDLGSATGVKVNGALIDVELKLKEGDQIQIGSVSLAVTVAGVAVNVPPPLAAAAGDAGPSGTVRVPPGENAARRAAAPTMTPGGGPGVAAEKAERKDVLFSPRRARPTGDVLEVVAYWGDTVLEVELFHPTFKGFENVTIGDPTKSHLIAAGRSHFDKYTLATIKPDGFKINLTDGMKARLRRGGKVEKKDDTGQISLGSRDIAHIKYGAVSYFLMFVKPPSLNLPRSGPADPFFLGLVAFAMVAYFVLIPIAWLHTPSKNQDDKRDDIIMVVQVPEKDKKPELEKEKQKKPEEQKKPPVKIAEKKTPPKTPPKPKPKDPVKPAKPVEVKEKPKQVKPVEKPVEEKKPTEVLTEAKEKKNTPEAKTPQKPSEAKSAGPVSKQDNNKNATPGPPSPNKSAKVAPPGDLSKLGTKGMPSTGAKTPDFKLAGPSLPNTALGKSGGVIGSGMNQKGAPIKGVGKADYKGVEGVNNNKASGVNLSKLGLGVGKIMSKTGPGAINTNFKSSAGGAGGGMGSASKTYGLGGVGSGKSLGLAGSGGAVNNFGSGSGGLLGGQGGSGGLGGAGLAGAFGGGGGGGGAGGGGKGGAGGHGRANVTVPPGDPVVSGGLTAQEIMAVIRANLNQIRHCYEQTLQRSPNAAGKMSVSFVVGTGGRVQSVSVTQSTISDSMMRGCVTGKIQRWAFPKPRGGQPVTVNYPFVFNPL